MDHIIVYMTFSMTLQVSFALKHGDEILFGNTLYTSFPFGGLWLTVLLRGHFLQSFLEEKRQFRRPSIGFGARKHSTGIMVISDVFLQTNFRHVVDSLKLDCVCFCLAFHTKNKV